MELNKNDMQQHIAAIELTEMLCGKPCDICKFYGQHPKCMPVHNAEKIAAAGYRKASEVALEAVDDFQRSIRHIFLDMCNGNDYNTLNLLQIDNAIEALFDCKIAEYKKKYTGSEK